MLYYPAGQITATLAYGQADLVHNLPNRGVITPTNQSLYQPSGVALDNDGSLYVADQVNNRVLYFPPGPPGLPAQTTATRVYGQLGNFTTSAATTTATGMNSPSGLALDTIGNLYVADQTNNRVLYFAAGQTTATQFYGQPDDTSSGQHHTANGLFLPWAVTLDSHDNLYVADTSNFRVLFYPAGVVTATLAYGQPDLTSATVNCGLTFPCTGVPSATSLNFPTGVRVDAAGALYVTDPANNRVLYFPPGPPGLPALTTATRVYGQYSFTTNVQNEGGLSALSLFGPNSAAGGPSDSLFVSDSLNNRVLLYAKYLTPTPTPTP